MELKIEAPGVATVSKEKKTGKWKSVAKIKDAQFTVPPGTVASPR
jgi:hypothetical protein